MKVLSCVFMSASLLMSGGCAHASETSATHFEAEHDYPESSPYDEAADAKAELETALARASADNKLVIIAMGANWCHDSRAFAGYLEQPRFTPLLEKSYETVYIDVGQRDRNIDIARRYGLDEIVGTPTVLIVTPQGEVLNLASAPAWRNAASRSEDTIYTYFKAYADQKNLGELD